MSEAEGPSADRALDEGGACAGDVSSQGNPLANVAALLLYCPVADFTYLLAISPALAAWQERGLSIAWSRMILLVALASYALVTPVALYLVLCRERRLIRAFVSGLFLGFLASLAALFVYAQYIVSSGRVKTGLLAGVCLLSALALALLWTGAAFALREFRVRSRMALSTPRG